VFACGDVTSAPVPRVGVIAEGEAGTVADVLIHRLRGGQDPAAYQGVASCYIEFGGAEVAKFDVNFLGGPTPSVTFAEPSLALAAAKKDFGATRRQRWFDRAKRPIISADGHQARSSVIRPPSRRPRHPGRRHGLRRPRFLPCRVRPLDDRARSGIDTGTETMPGVVRCTASNHARLPRLHHAADDEPALPRATARFVGDIVAMVIAETKRKRSTAEAVIVDYDPLPVVVDPKPLKPRTWCTAGRPSLANGMGTGPVEGVLDADVVVSGIVNQQVAPVPMEPGGIVAVPGEPAGGLTFHNDAGPTVGTRSQSSASTRRCGANAAVGGGFGEGGRHRRASSCRRPRWISPALRGRRPRREHGRDVARPRPRPPRRDGRESDGTITGLRVRRIFDAGVPAVKRRSSAQMMSQNVYVMPKVEFNWQAAIPEHHAGRRVPRRRSPGGDPLVERILDMAAAEIGMTRSRSAQNYIPPEASVHAGRRPRDVRHGSTRRR
jgi:hypothetical protein